LWQVKYFQHYQLHVFTSVFRYIWKHDTERKCRSKLNSGQPNWRENNIPDCARRVGCCYERNLRLALSIFLRVAKGISGVVCENLLQTKTIKSYERERECVCVCVYGCLLRDKRSAGMPLSHESEGFKLAFGGRILFIEDKGCDS
jgi:hypothetical protein